MDLRSVFFIQSAVALIAGGAVNYAGRTIKDVVDELIDNADILDAMHADQDHQAACPGCDHCRRTPTSKREIN